MSSRRSRSELALIVKTFLVEKGLVTPRDLAHRAGISRQSAHAHLVRLCEEGALLRQGRGRSTHYVASSSAAVTATLVRVFPLERLEEHTVWKQLAAQSQGIRDLPKRAFDIAYSAFSELLNNAIDHSGGSRAEIRIFQRAERFGFEIEDDGEGIFEHVRRLRGLATPLEALQDLSKGKVTTDSARHTGQGIFFSARALDHLELQSDGLRWSFDMLRNDTAFGHTPPRRGTLVRGDIALDTRRELKAIFDAYGGEHFAFSKTQTWVKLFDTGLQFISRSEAKRLLLGLEHFEEVVLDFTDVTQLGQGFADEVFRVWAHAHPTTLLRPIHQAPAIEAMVKRAIDFKPL